MAVIACICSSSSIQCTAPTAAISAEQSSRCAALTCGLANSAVTPCPMAAGVFGMARTIGVRGPKAASKRRMVVPAAIDSTTAPLATSIGTRAAPRPWSGA